MIGRILTGTGAKCYSLAVLSDRFRATHHSIVYVVPKCMHMTNFLNLIDERFSSMTR